MTARLLSKLNRVPVLHRWQPVQEWLVPSGMNQPSVTLVLRPAARGNDLEGRLRIETIPLDNTCTRRLRSAQQGRVTKSP